MSRSVDPTLARRALAQRLRAAARVLLDDPLPAPDDEPARDAAVVLDLLVRRVYDEPTADRAWLLFTAISSGLPTPDEVQSVIRRFELSSVPDVTLWLLDTAMAAARTSSPTRELVVTDRVVIDVDHSARYALHTGIQQVVRNTVPLWEADHDVVLVAWTPGGTALRALSPAEHDRVTRWGALDEGIADTADQPLVVPWRTTVILAEVPALAAAERLAAIGQFSGNRLTAIGYDCIPIVSAPMVPLEEPNKFARYLSAVKYAHHVIGISISATIEFRGFAAALPTQGLPGPIVTECLLPSEGLARQPVPAPPADPDLPEVLAVGSFEPRKNHLALLYAAERLWAEGRRFRLRLIGGSGWGNELPLRVRQLQSGGRTLTIERGVSNDELTRAYERARFSVFASLHEGYGLPVAESIALGTPVITSNYGSTREVGEGRGAVLVNPRDDDALLTAMRQLLDDDVQLESLRRETDLRPGRTWVDYAGEAWQHLVGTGGTGGTVGTSGATVEAQA